MKPIIMSAEDARALLDGRKTMARVPIKPQPYYFYNSLYEEQKPLKGDRLGAVMPDNTDSWIKSPYRPGDVLWVRETWAKNTDYANPALYIPHGFIHKATGEYHMGVKWRSPATMPREAVRLFLRVTDVRVERVQEISGHDAELEGFRTECGPLSSCPTCNISEFHKAWDARNAKRGYGWDSNPWVWVIEFKRTQSGAIGP